jgi:predicted nuclease with TOPRIM domain
MSSSIAKDIYDGLKKIITVEDRISRLAESLKRADEVLHDHAQRLARLEGKFELLEHTLASPRRRLPEKSS